VSIAAPPDIVISVQKIGLIAELRITERLKRIHYQEEGSSE
jgi:hypothetical protein